MKGESYLNNAIVIEFWKMSILRRERERDIRTLSITHNIVLPLGLELMTVTKRPSQLILFKLFFMMFVLFLPFLSSV